jgi:DNA-binding CsgD family transcriptional regulator
VTAPVGLRSRVETSPRTVPFLLERDAELERLAERAAAASRGAGSVVVVEGPAGIGKTALVEAAVRAAGEQGLRALVAAGAELEPARAYGVVSRLLEPAIPPGGDELLQGPAAPAASVLHRAPGAPWDLATDAAPEVLAGLQAVCERLAAQTPLLLVVDDAHWADDASLRWLLHVARAIERLPVLLLVAARHVEAALARLAYGEAALLLQPAPLGPAALAALMERDLGHAPTEALVAAVRESTGGIPLFVRELARGLRESGERSDDHAVRRLRHWAPARTRVTVVERARAAGPGAVGLAEAVAVLGSDALLHRAAALAGLDVEDAALVADALTRAGLLTGELRPMRVAHPVLAAALHDAMPSGRRAILHARAATLLDAEHVDVERVAGQLLLTEPAGDARRAAILRAAGQRAAAQGAFEAAVVHLRRALAEQPASPERAPLLLELGCVESYVGETAAIEHLEAALAAAPAGAGRVAAAFALGRVLEFGGRHAQAFAVLERTARELGAEQAELAAVLDAALLSAAQLDSATAGETPRLVAALRSREALPPAAHGPLALAAAMANEPAEEVADLARRALPGDLELLPADADAPPFFYQATVALIVVERFEEAAEHLERGLRHALLRRSALHLTTLLVLRGWLRLRVGSLAGAEADARRALAEAESPMPAHLALLARAVLAETLLDVGRLDAASAALAKADVEAPGARTSAGALFHLHAAGRLALEQARPEAACERFAAAERLAAALGASTVGIAWRAHGALAAAQAGAAVRARELADRDEALARRFGGAGAMGRARRVAALVGPAGSRLAGLEAAVALLAGSGARLEHARALTDLGSAQRRAGRRRAARQTLLEALDAAHRCGAAPLAARARAELVAAGARPRRQLLRGPEALTASERRVAGLAARGLTNRQIGEALTVAPRTVEGHLTRVYGKLGIASRTEIHPALGDLD